MKRLRMGTISRVEMNIFHMMMYKQNHVTTSEEWKEMLDMVYVWFDWASMPQPSASPDLSPKEREEMGANLTKAVRSIPAYVEKSDFVAVVAPGCLHADRRDPRTKHRAKTCYRTYRARGWCVLEIFASYLSRDKTHPALLIKSPIGTPEWISPIDVLKLAVGTCDFTCCQRNHIFGDKVVPCDRGITRSILEKLIDSKVQHLFQVGNVKLARLTNCMKQWWLRSGSPSKIEDSCKTLQNLKDELKWNDELDGTNKMSPWTDRFNISILLYAMAVNKLSIVKEVLKIYEYSLVPLLAWKFPKEGVVEVGIPGFSTCLYGAMCFASPEIVAALLDSSADVLALDVTGSDAFMAGCAFGRLENIQMWLRKQQKWKINRVNTRFGSSALSIAVYLGVRNSNLVRYLVEKKGANLQNLNKNGHSLLTLISSNDDADPNTLQYLLSRGLDVSHRVHSQTTKWKLIRLVARLVVRTKVMKSVLIRRIAEGSGTTALHYAVRSGDVELVEILMQHGANPSVKNDLGRDVFSYCEVFPEIKNAIKRLMDERKYGRAAQTPSSLKTNGDVESSTSSRHGTVTLQRSVSTATPVKYDMYLVSLTTLIHLLGDEEERKKNKNISHQELLERGELTRFEDLPMGAFVMFISHQWNGFDHPDPTGVLMKCLVNMLMKLQKGEIDHVEMDPFHQLLYKHNYTTKSKEWKQLLSRAYIWYLISLSLRLSYSLQLKSFIEKFHQVRLALSASAKRKCVADRD